VAGGENGVPEAQFWLGVASSKTLWFGLTEQQEALKWYKGRRNASYRMRERIGSAHQDGDGVEQNYVQAPMVS